MVKRLEGKVAIVTGSGQGVGRGIAIAMAREGAKVVTNNRTPRSSNVKDLEAAIDPNLTEAERQKFSLYADGHCSLQHGQPDSGGLRCPDRVGGRAGHYRFQLDRFAQR